MSKNTEQNNDNAKAKAKAKAAAEDIERDQQGAKVPTGESLLERASALTKDSSPDLVDDILRDAAKIEVTPNMAAAIMKALYECADTDKTTLKDSWKLFKSEHKKAKKKEKKNRARGGTPLNADKFWFDTIEECMDAINKNYSLVMRDGEMRVVYWDDDDKPIFLRERDARVKLGQYLIFQEEDEPPHNGFRLWLQSPERKEYKRVVFNPRATAVGEDELNLWKGFAAKGEKGDWSLLRNHIRDNICQGNATHFDFVMAWMAQMFREPWKKSGVAIVLRGLKGVGKTKLSEWLRKAVGLRHSLWVDSPHQWTGKFNGQLETVIFLGCEEGFFAGDPQAVSRINHIVTAPLLPYERKGKDIYEGPNYTRILMTSNADWVVPATVGERRFFVLDVGSKQKQNAAYFKAIDEQMESGGLEAMMHDLMRYDFTKVDFVNPPMTDALADQIRVGFSPQLKWFESILTDGGLSFKDDEGDRQRYDWPEIAITDDKNESPEADKKSVFRGLEIPKDGVVASYREAVPGFRSPAQAQEIGKFLAKHVPGLESDRQTVFGKRVWFWVFPDLGVMREAFLKANPGYSFPPEPKQRARKEEDKDAMAGSNVHDLAKKRASTGKWS